MRGLRYVVLVLILALSSPLLHPGIIADELAPADNGSDTISYVSSAEPVYSSYESYLAQRWGVVKIEAPQAWCLTEEGQPVIVAVLDTGIDEDNQDLAARMVAEANFTDSSTSDDLCGHGTHMAGTIATMAPECQLMNVKVADDLGRCQASAIADGIIWAVDHGAEVINISLCVKPLLELEEAVNYAWSQGVVIVVAAGNEGKSTPAYPAYYAQCLAVAATNEDDRLALLSNYGDWVDVAAPGFNIYSTLPDNQDGYRSGTSPAAAHVSGVAALVFSVAKDINGNGLVNDEVRQAIEDSCSLIDADGVGRGRINAFDAVTQAISLN